MLIEFVQGKNKFIVELWHLGPDDAGFDTGFKEPHNESKYVEINNWCIEQFNYHARTAYNRFEFKQQSDLEWFILKWG